MCVFVFFMNLIIYFKKIILFVLLKQIKEKIESNKQIIYTIFYNYIYSQSIHILYIIVFDLI